MADAVGSAVAQEAMSRAVSFVLSKQEAAASKRHSIEKLEMAYTELKFALERSSKLPITDVSLLQQRRMVKRAYEECEDVLHRCKLRVQEDEKVEQGVTYSSPLRKSIHYIKSFIPSLGSLKKDELSCSDVGRFEWFADKAGKFVRDVETGCSLAHYRFFSPLIKPLLEGKELWYKQVRGSRTNDLLIAPVWSEERGVEACIMFNSEDRMTPNKSICLGLGLRLSESMDIVGIAIKCVQLLGPVFNPFAEVAIGELAQLPMQDVSRLAVLKTCLCADVTSAIKLRPDPFCCRADGHGPCANDPVTSKFPAQVTFMCFNCSIPAFGYVLELWAHIAPHDSFHSLHDIAVETIGGRVERINGSLRQMEEMLLTNAIDLLICQMEEMQLTNAIDRFIYQPDLTEYGMVWRSAHGGAVFTLRKPTKGRSVIRRVAKTRCKLQIRG